MEVGTINNIPIKHLLNSTSTKLIKGDKFFGNIEIHTITTAATVNNVNVSLLKSASRNFWEVLPSEYVFNGQVNLRNLHLEVLNGVALHSWFKDVYLPLERSQLRGNFFVHDALSTVNLSTKLIMDTLVSDLLTTSTDQAVKADCSIAKFYTSKVNTQFVNNEKLNETAALADSNNFVEGRIKEFASKKT